MASLRLYRPFNWSTTAFHSYVSWLPSPREGNNMRFLIASLILFFTFFTKGGEFDELKYALKNEKQNIVHETSDVIYHLLVSLESAGIKFEDVLVELEKRKKQSGIDEKNSRI